MRRFTYTDLFYYTMKLFTNKVTFSCIENATLLVKKEVL